MIKKVLNKWQLDFAITKDYTTLSRGWKVFRFGIFKIHTFMPENGVLTKKYYHGFIIRFLFWLPIDFI